MLALDVSRCRRPRRVVIVLLRRLGMATPKAPVSGERLERTRALSGRSPKPLPKNSVGVTVSNDSAPTFLLPVPPTSQSTPAESRVSCSLALEEDVLQRDLHVVEARSARAPSSGSRILQVAAEREAEVAAEPLRELGADGRLARGRALVLAAQLDVRDRRQRQLVGDERIVDGQRGREEPLADEPVRRGRRTPSAATSAPAASRVKGRDVIDSSIPRAVRPGRTGRAPGDRARPRGIGQAERETGGARPSGTRTARNGQLPVRRRPTRRSGGCPGTPTSTPGAEVPCSSAVAASTGQEAPASGSSRW